MELCVLSGLQSTVVEPSFVVSERRVYVMWMLLVFCKVFRSRSRTS
ncbi:unnamed protein product, partial [Colias eurytheme]